MNPGLFFIWQVFGELNSHRSIGMDANPLSVIDIFTMLKIHGVTNREELLEDFRYITILDDTILSWKRDKNANS